MGKLFCMQLWPLYYPLRGTAVPLIFTYPETEKMRHGTLSHRTYMCHGTLLFSFPSCVYIKKQQ